MAAETETGGVARLRSLWSIVLLGLPLWGFGDELGLSKSDRDFLETLPTLKVVADDNFAPLSQWNPDTQSFEGISVDLFREAARRLGLRYEFLRDPSRTWGDWVRALQGGQIDVLLPVSFTPDRAELGLFSTSYYQTYYSAIGHKDAALAVGSAADLARFRVGVIQDTSIVPYAQEVVPAEQLALLENAQALYASVRQGKVDVVLQNQFVFREDRFDHELFDLTVLQTLVEWPRAYSFYFPKNEVSSRLVSLVDQALVGIPVSPLIAQYERGAEDLILRYLDQKHRQDLLGIGLATAVLGVVLLGIILWNQRRLKESEIRFRALSEASFGGIAIHDKGVILECNQALSDLTGHSEAQLIGMDGLLLVAPEHRDFVLDNIRSGQSRSYEVVGLRKDGSRYPVGVRGKTIPYQGKMVRVTEFYDLTDQKRAEEATRAAKAQYDRLVEKLPVGVYVLRTRPGFVAFDYVSPPMADMVGVAAERILEDFSMAFTIFHPEERDAFIQANNEAIAQTMPFDWEGRCLRQGETRWFHISSQPDPQPNGDVLWHGLMVDITERRLSADRIEGLLAEKELILREVHHRIKNNMSTVSGLLTLQAATLADPAAVAALEDAKGRVLSMMVLYDRLYLSADRAAVSLSDYLPNLVDQVLGNFPNSATVEWRTEAENLVLDAASLSSLGIIVNELLTNVMKYAQARHIEVTAKRVGSRVQVIVADDGRGLPEGFDPAQSTGFGLSLVGMMTKSLKGTLSIEGPPGTRFIIDLPGPRLPASSE